MDEAARILVVDDDEDVLDLFSRHLCREEREVLCVNHPQEALKQIREACWDVIITDISMPTASGFDVISEAHKKEQLLPCIVITGRGTVEVVQRALEIDCFGYVNKPFDWNYLNGLVDKAVRSIQRHRRCSASGSNAERAGGPSGGRLE